jgi:hypothetical protein
MFKRTLSHPEAAAEAIAYYESRLAREPGAEEWALGLEVARWWQRLLQSDNPAPEEVSRLTLVLAAKRREMGPAWLDLCGRVETWRRERNQPRADL